MKILNINPNSNKAISDVFDLVNHLKLKYCKELIIDNSYSMAGCASYDVTTKTILLNIDPNLSNNEEVVRQLSHELMHHIVCERAGIKTDIQPNQDETMFYVAFSLFVLTRTGYDECVRKGMDDLHEGRSEYSKWSKTILDLFVQFLLENDSLNAKIESTSIALTKRQVIN